MEKKRPTYNLRAIQRAIGSTETLAITTSALRDALSMGFDRFAIVKTIGSIDSRMFYKSMTTYADHRVWQDVYHAGPRPSDLRQVSGRHHHRIQSIGVQGQMT